MTDESHNEASCDRCPLVARRDFLRDAGLAAAAILAALGGAPSTARAMEMISPIAGNAQEKTYAIPAKDGVQIDKDNDTMITRWQGKLYVYGLACPHQNTVLKWRDKNSEFECPKHHSRFSPDGIYVKDSGRATRGLDRFAIRKDGGNVVVDLEKLYQEDEHPAEWKSAFITL